MDNESIGIHNPWSTHIWENTPKQGEVVEFSYQDHFNHYSIRRGKINQVKVVSSVVIPDYFGQNNVDYIVDVNYFLILVLGWTLVSILLFPKTLLDPWKSYKIMEN
jgi:hypothetical protein